MSADKIYKLKLATAEFEATVEKIIRTVDVSTLAPKENPNALLRDDVGEIIFKLKFLMNFITTLKSDK